MPKKAPNAAAQAGSIPNPQTTADVFRLAAAIRKKAEAAANAVQASARGASPEQAAPAPAAVAAVDGHLPGVPRPGVLTLFTIRRLDRNMAQVIGIDYDASTLLPLSEPYAAWKDDTYSIQEGKLEVELSERMKGRSIYTKNVRPVSRQSQ